MRTVVNIRDASHLSEIMKEASTTWRDKVASALNSDAQDTLRDVYKLTPVDTGVLRSMDRADVKRTPKGLSLTFSNQMVYARRQHEEFYNHPAQGTQRKYIEVPFLRDLPTFKKTIDDTIRRILTDERISKS
jgi:hypothetical protein